MYSQAHLSLSSQLVSSCRNNNICQMPTRAAASQAQESWVSERMSRCSVGTEHSVHQCIADLPVSLGAHVVFWLRGDLAWLGGGPRYAARQCNSTRRAINQPSALCGDDRVEPDNAIPNGLTKRFPVANDQFLDAGFRRVIIAPNPAESCKRSRI